MGFLDKAKQMAEQAQAKLDEAQKQFNAGQQKDQGAGPAVEYDKHGRPIPQPEADAAAPPQGDPLAAAAPAPEAPAPPAAPPAPAPPAAEAPVPPAPAPPAAEAPAPPAAPTAPPAAPPADAPVEDRNHPSYAPPKLTSGDPLAG
jgi:hypothetical protein